MGLICREGLNWKWKMENGKLGFVFLFFLLLWLDRGFGSDSTWGALFIIQSIKTMVAGGGSQSQVKKIERLIRKERFIKGWGGGPLFIQAIISFCLWPFAFVLCYNFAGVGRSTLGFLPSIPLPPPPFPFLSFTLLFGLKWIWMNPLPLSFSCQFPISHIPSPSPN